jgi:ATP-dependent Clp endopeptidase proteolytic subunit ClpP
MKLSYRNDHNAKYIAASYNKPLDKPDWYKITNVSEDEADIYIMDYIGWPFNSAEDFVKNLASMTQSKITIRINSPGGDVWDAHAIHNAIKRHKSKPTTCIESLAASAASYIAVAGHKKTAYKNSMVMIHEPMTGLWGNQFDLRETADILAEISNGMVDMYADNTSVGKRELKEMMKAETWMSAKTAKEKGFIDSIVEDGKGVKAEFDLSIFSNLPDEFRDDSQGRELTRKETERALRNAGASREYARALAAKRADASDVEDPPAVVPPIIVPPQIIDNSSLIAALQNNITLLGGN